MSARTSQPDPAPASRSGIARAAVASLCAFAMLLASPPAHADPADPAAPVELVPPRDPVLPATPASHDAIAAAQTRAPQLGGAFDGRVLWTEPAPEPAALSRNAEPYCARLGTQLDGSLAVSEGGLANALIRLRAIPTAPETPEHPEHAAKSRRARKANRRDAALAAAAASAPAPSSSEPPAEPPLAHLALASCAFAPRVLALVPGQHLAVESADPILHSLRLTREHSVVFRQTLEPSEPAPELRFTEPGVYRVGCDVHPWEVAWVVVSPPEDAAEISVTDAQGHFRIDGLAPGSYQLDAWHERATIKGPPVRIRAGASQHGALHATPTTELAHEDSQAHPAQ